MISLPKIVVFSLGITLAVAWDPDCERCEYQNGIGFVASDEFCQVYFMCVKNPYYKPPAGMSGENPYKFRWYTFCCAEGLRWDQAHLTCKLDAYCKDSREKCPNATTTTDLPCPWIMNKKDNTKFIHRDTYEQLMCPYEQDFSEKYCTCVPKYQPRKAPCAKILHYNFTGNYDSRSCYNFAVGEPYGKPSLDGDVLKLNGIDQFVSSPYLNNWFAWNPVGKSFTLCFWIKADTTKDYGILSTNCYYQGQESVAEFWTENQGQVVAKLGGEVFQSGKSISYSAWSKVCVVFNKGKYTFYFNGEECGMVDVSPKPINSQNDMTIGFVKGKKLLYGYIDDVCFWTRDLSADEIEECYQKGPSNDE